MFSAFQKNAFQNNAFQIAIPGASGSGAPGQGRAERRRLKRRREFIPPEPVVLKGPQPPPPEIIGPPLQPVPYRAPADFPETVGAAATFMATRHHIQAAQDMSDIYDIMSEDLEDIAAVLDLLDD